MKNELFYAQAYSHTYLPRHIETQKHPHIHIHTQTNNDIHVYKNALPLFFEFTIFRFVSPAGFPGNNPFLLFTQLKCKQ